jgi:hypothetical protein
MPMAMTKLSRPISAYLRENVHYTFSGFNFTPTFLDLMLQVGVERIMFSAGHPYCIPGAGASLPGPIACEQRRQGANRARKRGTPLRILRWWPGDLSA